MDVPSAAKSLCILGEVVTSGQKAETLKSDIDEDLEDIADIVSRLGHDREPLVSVVCTCDDVSRCPSQIKVRKNRHDSDSSSEEDEDFGLNQLLKAFDIYNKKDPSKRSPSALRNLLHSYKCSDVIPTNDIKKISQYVESDDKCLAEASIMLLDNISTKEANIKSITELMLPSLFRKLSTVSLADTVICHILGLINQVVKRSCMKDCWIDYVREEELNLVNSLLSGVHSRSIRLKAAAIFKTLIQYPEFTGFIVEQVANNILVFRAEGVDYQVIYTEFATKLMLVCSSAQLEDVNIESDILPSLILMLTEGPCDPQHHSLCLISSLVTEEEWIRRMLKNSVVPLIMSAAVDSQCRKVRSQAAASLSVILQADASSIQKLVLLHTDHCLHGHEGSKDSNTPRSQAFQTLKNQSGKTSKSDIYAKLQRSVKDICKHAVDDMGKTAQLEKNPDGSGIVIHISPGCEPVRISCLSNSVLLMITLTKLKTSRAKIKLDSLTEQELEAVREIRSKWYKVNHTMIKQLFSSGALCVIDILHKYTSHLERLSADSTTRETQGGKQAWNNPTHSKPSHKIKAPVTADVFSEEEQQLLSHILDLIQLWSSASSLHDTSTPAGSGDEENNIETRYKEAVKLQVKDSMRYTRKKLFQSGVISCLRVILALPDQPMTGALLKEKSLLILADMVQPLDEKIHSSPAPPQASATGERTSLRRRPVSAMTAKEKEKVVNVALYRMSEGTRDCIKEVLEEGTPDGKLPETTPTTPPRQGNSGDNQSNNLSKTWPKCDKSVVNVEGEGNGSLENSMVDASVDNFIANEVVDSSINETDASSTPGESHILSADLQREENFNELLQVADPIYGEMFERPSSEMGYMKSDYDKFARPTSRPKSARNRLISVDYDLAREKYSKTPRGNGHLSNRTNYHERVVQARPKSRQSLVAKSQTSVLDPNSKSARKSKNKSALRPTSAKTHDTKNHHQTVRISQQTPRKAGEKSLSRRRSEEEPNCLKWKPDVDPVTPVCVQCQSSTAQLITSELMKHVFSKCGILKSAAVQCLHEAVRSGNQVVHMKMSEFGIIPKMVDFLRVNDDQEIFLITGLKIIQVLVQSDSRLNRLFSHHNGSQLLMALSASSTGAVRSEVTATLKLVTRGNTSVTRGGRGLRRIQSAPVGGSTRQAPDIWDHLLMRWRNEDQVSSVLRKPMFLR